MAAHSQCRQNHEVGSARERKDSQGGKRVHARMRVRVYQLHYQRSVRKMSAREAQDGKRRRHIVRNDFPGLRELLGSFENLLSPLSRDGSHETLLASQKSAGTAGAPGSGSGTSNTNAGANASASAPYTDSSNDAILGEALEDATGYETFSAAVHNGNGTAEY